MSAARSQIAPLIVATALMNVGIAAVASGAPVAQQASGHGDATIALAAAVSSLGTIVGALLAGRGGHGRFMWLVAMALLSGGAGVGAGVLGTASSLWIVPARLLDGLALGGALVASETLLLHAVDARKRASAMALYGIATAAGFILGPAIAGALVAAQQVAGAFVVGVGGAVACSVVVAVFVPARTMATTATMTTSAATTSTTTWSTLWRRNIVPWSTTFHYGAFQGAALVLLPLRLLADGVDGAGATALVAFYACGMLLLTYPVSKLGARLSTTTVMIVLCAVGGAAAICIASVPLQALPVRALLAFVAGGSVATLSPLSLALQARRNPAADLGRVNGLYNACYASGMLLGPLVVAATIDVVGVAALLTALGVVWWVHAIGIAAAERLQPATSSTTTSTATDLPVPDSPLEAV